MEDGGIEWEPIEFVDSDADRDDGHAAQVTWISEDEVGAGANRNDGRLPPRTTFNRVAASLLALAVFLAGIGASGRAADDRHVTDRRIANLLELQSGPAAPSIPGLAQLAFGSVWHASVSEDVSFPVVNRSPEPVTLLSAVLSESGLVSSSPLEPVGERQLAPGQAGTVVGTVTADCTRKTGPQAISSSPLGELVGEFALPVLSVRARTSGGKSAVSRLDPEASSQLDVQQRICLQQGYGLLAVGGIDSAANPGTHTITLRMSARADTAAAVAFAVSAAYSDTPTEHVPGLVISAQPVSESPMAGTLTPGGRLSIEYSIKVSSCPVGVSPRPDQVEVEVDAYVNSLPLQGALRSTNLAPLIERVCDSRT